MSILEKKMDSINKKLDLETRLKEIVVPIFKKFRTNQEVIKELIEESSPVESKGVNQRANFENRYYLICGQIKALI